VGDALTRCDGDALGHLFANDFIGINPLSIEVTKAGMLSQIGSSDYAPESIINEVLRVRVFGEVARPTPARYRLNADRVVCSFRVFVFSWLSFSWTPLIGPRSWAARAARVCR
jgi:hypothetical protein